MNSRLLGRLLVILSAFSWGLSATLARSVFRDSGVPPLQAVELRVSIAFTVLLLWTLFRDRRAWRIERRDVGYLAVLGLVGVTAVQATYYHAIATLGVGMAILLQYLAPSLIVLWHLLRGQRPQPSMLFAVLFALIGTGCIVRGMDARTMHATSFDWFIGFASAVIFAFYILYSKRGLLRYRPETLLLYTFGIAALFWMVVIPPTHIVEAGYPMAVWLRFGLLGVFSTLVPFWAFYAGLRRLPPAEASVIATLEPVIGIVASAVFLHESLGVVQMFGAAAVIFAAILATRDPSESAGATDHVA
ncbi:MAG: hypothetical protein RL760_9 [Candidatus Eisenbacteria bacterium]